MRWLFTCIFVALLLLAADAQAAGRWRQARQARLAHERAAHDRAVVADVIHHPPAPDPRVIYPQYQGGFHSRALQNIGVPTGDIGIRGNGFMMNPW
jgi:hypothetical protein